MGFQKIKKFSLWGFCFFYLMPFLVVGKSLGFSKNVYIFFVFWGILATLVFFYFLVYLQNGSAIAVRESLKNDEGIADLKLAQNENFKMGTKLRVLIEELNEKNVLQKKYIGQITQLREICKNQESEYHHLSQDLHNQLEQKERLLSEFRQTINDQRRVIEKKQENINTLNMQMDDLKYEMDNLLKLNREQVITPRDVQVNKSNPSFLEQSKAHMSLTRKLQQLIDSVQKMPYAPSFIERGADPAPSLGTLLIEQRRLFDYFEGENSDVVLIYSVSNKQLLFVNHRIQNLLGWNPKEFVENFPSFVQKGLGHFEDVVSHLTNEDQGEVQLIFKNSAGKSLLTHCYLKQVPTGAFQGHLIGILTAAATRGL